MTQSRKSLDGGAHHVTPGIAFMLVGVYFLATAPSESTGFDAIPQVANLHQLTIDETCSIVGAIFVAAGIRPRWVARIDARSPLPIQLADNRWTTNALGARLAFRFNVKPVAHADYCG